MVGSHRTRLKSPSYLTLLCKQVIPTAPVTVDQWFYSYQFINALFNPDYIMANLFCVLFSSGLFRAFLFGKKSMHWSVWPSVILCLIGGYLLTNFHDATVRLGDTLVVLGALFWSTHIIFTGIIITKYNLPLTLGAAQTLIVAIFSFIIGIVYEEFILSNILMEIYSILYAGILSGGFAFVLQIYAQRNITPAPAAIIFSLEGVFATIAAWFILNQILDVNNLLGCFFILCGVLLSQLLPLIKKKYT